MYNEFEIDFGGLGAAMASMSGKAIARAIINDSNIDNPLKVENLRPIPFRSQTCESGRPCKVF
ncbi:MAG TPA: hypothetical protein VK085_11860 [Pseudogracilibacillus sp.]|nr:hypothetical protein [Pseudogracilibacillus sp.]